VNSTCQRHRHFEIEIEAGGGGEDCDYEDDEELYDTCDNNQCVSPSTAAVVDDSSVDCVGEWGRWESCEWVDDTCQKHRHFEIEIEAGGNGEDCDYEDDYPDWSTCDPLKCPAPSPAPATTTTVKSGTDQTTSSTSLAAVADDDMDFFIAILVLITSILVIFVFSWIWKKLKSRKNSVPHSANSMHASSRPSSGTKRAHTVVPVTTGHEDDDWFSDDEVVDAPASDPAHHTSTPQHSRHRKEMKKSAKKAKKAAKKAKKSAKAKKSTKIVLQQKNSFTIPPSRDGTAIGGTPQLKKGLEAAKYESVQPQAAPVEHDLDSLDDDDFDAFEPDWGDDDGDVSSDELPSPHGGGGHLSRSSVGIDAGLADDDMSFNVEW